MASSLWGGAGWRRLPWPMVEFWLGTLAGDGRARWLGRAGVDGFAEPGRGYVRGAGPGGSGDTPHHAGDGRDESGHATPGGHRLGHRHDPGRIRRASFSGHRARRFGAGVYRPQAAAARRIRPRARTDPDLSARRKCRLRRLCQSDPVDRGAAQSSPQAPMSVAATGPRVIRLAARVAESITFSVGADPARLKASIDLARQARRAAGLPPMRFGAYFNAVAHPDIRVRATWCGDDSACTPVFRRWTERSSTRCRRGPRGG